MGDANTKPVLYFEGCPVPTHPLFQFAPGPISVWHVHREEGHRGLVATLRVKTSHQHTAGQMAQQVFIPFPCIYVTGTYDITDVETVK